MKEENRGIFGSLFGKKKSTCCDEAEKKEIETLPIVVEEQPSEETSEKSTHLRDVEIIVWGAGCSKCKTTYSLIEKLIQEYGLSVKLTKKEDIVELMQHNILSTPSVTVNGEVKIRGYVPTVAEVKKILKIS